MKVSHELKICVRYLDVWEAFAYILWCEIFTPQHREETWLSSLMYSLSNPLLETTVSERDAYIQILLHSSLGAMPTIFYMQNTFNSFQIAKNCICNISNICSLLHNSFNKQKTQAHWNYISTVLYQYALSISTVC